MARESSDPKFVDFKSAASFSIKTKADTESKLNLAAPAEPGSPVLTDAQKLLLPSPFPAADAVAFTSEQRDLQSLELVANQAMESGEKVLALGVVRPKPILKIFLVILPIFIALAAALDPASFVLYFIQMIAVFACTAFWLSRETRACGVRFMLTNKRILEVNKEDVRWKIIDQVNLVDILSAQAAPNGQSLVVQLKSRYKTYRTDDAQKIVGLINSVCPRNAQTQALIASMQARLAIIIAAVLLIAGALVAVSISTLNSAVDPNTTDAGLSSKAIHKAQVYLPPGLSNGKKYPLIVALSLDSNNLEQLNTIKAACKANKCIGAAIDVDDSSDGWFASFSSQLKAITAKYAVDPKNIYIAGYGGAGVGAYYLLEENPHFAGLIIDRAALTYGRNKEAGPMPDSFKHHYKVALIAQRTDENYGEMQSDCRTLSALHWSTTWIEGTGKGQGSAADYQTAISSMLKR